MFVDRWLFCPMRSCGIERIFIFHDHLESGQWKISVHHIRIALERLNLLASPADALSAWQADAVTSAWLADLPQKTNRSSIPVFWADDLIRAELFGLRCFALFACLVSRQMKTLVF